MADGGRRWLIIAGSYATWTQSWFNAVSTYTTLAQHCVNIGLLSRVCRDKAERLAIEINVTR